MTTVENDYRMVLRKEFERRCARNPRYSLRAFAKQIELSPSMLSEILNGRHGLSRRRAFAIARALGYSEQEREVFCDLVESVHGRSEMTRKLAEIRLAKHEPQQNYLELEADAFTAIAEWHHYAILELTYLEGFRSDPAWIARALGIPVNTAVVGIERLKRLGLLEEKNGALSCKEQYVTNPRGMATDAVKLFHRQILEKAMLAVDGQARTERDLGAVVMAIDESRVAEAKEALLRFRRNFTRRMNGGKSTAVYCLATQFLRLSQPDSTLNRGNA